KLLNKYVKIKFVDDIFGKKAMNTISLLKEGEAILLDNIRKENDEFKPEKRKSNKLYKLVDVCDVYVNDAFSVCHRQHSSIVLFPRYIESYTGLLLQKELNALKKLHINKPLCILGGAKPEDNLKLINKQVKKVLAGGIFGQMCLIARGVDLGKNNEKVNKKIVKDYDGLLKIISKQIRNQNIIMPVDYAVLVGNQRKEFDIKDFPTPYVIYDIGEKSIELFKKEIKKAKAIYMKGPVGDAALKGFDIGTKQVLKAISKSKAFSVIGGGHLSDAINKSYIRKSKFNHISLSGGALLRYIAGEKLVGLEVLR
ncbi:MAG: phosphoglycerate kinase, partial [Candidatus Nanoarchaeia archaeon]